jgi:D-arabinose 1-dehydrogenase-like Zn-dependent alcohol dehydrogenase
MHAPSGPIDVVVEAAGAALGVEPAAEIAGTVVEAGEGAREWIGCRVVVPRLLPCGDCDHCRRGRVAACPTLRARPALERRQTVPARWLTSVEPPLWPDGVELWQLAALADAALSPYTALSRAGVGPSDTVVVVGHDARAGFARQIAAAKGAKLVDAPVDGAVVLATQPREWARALSQLVAGATVALLDGPGSAEFATDWSRIVAAEAHLLGVVGGHPDLLPELCALVVRGQLRLADAVRPVAAAEAEAARTAYLSDGSALPILVWA